MSKYIKAFAGIAMSTVVASTLQAASSDFNGDGFSDILFKKPDGSYAVTLMNASGKAGQLYVMDNKGWIVEGTGDINGDSFSDILFRKPDGSFVVTYMNASGKVGQERVMGDRGWIVKGTGDLNGDGKCDALFQKADGSLIVKHDGGQFYIGSVLNKSVEAIADFNGDNFDDVLIQNENGTRIVWYMGTSGKTSSAVAMDASLESWDVVGTGDFNNNGNDDLLLQKADGSFVISLLDNSNQTIHVMGNKGWTVEATGDYTGDGKSDALFQKPDGSLVVMHEGGQYFVMGNKNWSVEPHKNNHLRKIGSFETSLEGGSEIVAFDATSKRMFTTNGANNAIDIIDISNPAKPTLVSSIDLSPYGDGVNSVSVKNGKVAVAVDVKTDDYMKEFVNFGEWSAVSVASDYVWLASSYQGKPFAKMNGYGDASGAADDWLISPAFTFDGTQVLTFENAKNFSGPDLQLYVSTDYNGSNVTTASWTELSFTKSTGSYTFVNSGDVNLSAYTGTAHIAFRYTSTGSASGQASAWEVANVRVTNMNTGAKDKGKVVLFDTNGTLDKSVTVGFLPDMVTFNEDGTKVVVANEGEPNGRYNVDGMGSVGVVTVADGSYTDINFMYASLTAATDGTEVRLGGTPSNHKAYDIEPEYVAVSGDYAYVTLQENNAMAKIDLVTNALEYVKSYGAKSYEAGSGNKIDIEEEGDILMKSYTGLFGLYQPDSIASYEVNGTTFLVTANEGDGREYLYDDENGDEQESWVDEKKIKKLNLDSSIEAEYDDENDLKVMIDLGDTDGDGDYDKLYAYGARSFSIWDTDGNLVFDSGDIISKLVAKYEPTLFNQDEGDMDGRSGNKGAEPEALTVGVIDGSTYAFVGLERQNAIIIFNITDPANVSYVDYIRTGKDGDISAEGMKFVPAAESPNGRDLLLVSYEVSGSTVVYEIVK